MAAFKSLGVVVLSGTLVLGACTNPDGTANNTNTGAGVGALVGGLFGRAISPGNPTGGTVIGAGVGAIIGGAIGADLDAQEAALRSQLGGTVGIVNDGSQLIVSLPEDITFNIDSSVVKPSLVGDLYKLANVMNEYPNTTIRVVGHTDNTGSTAYNQALSQQRARAVKGILVNGGVDGNRIIARGVGETQPIASNGTAEGRQQNRRVEIYIIPNN